MMIVIMIMMEFMSLVYKAGMALTEKERKGKNCIGRKKCWVAT